MPPRIETLCAAGGLFVLLTFWHFVADFVFQTHRQAMNKRHDRLIRAEHCMIYSSLFLPVFWFIGLNYYWQGVACWFVLFVSHYIGDSYVPVYLWARYIRRASVMRDDSGGSPMERFKVFASTPFEKFLLVIVDQVFHTSFLWFPVWLALR